MRRLHNLSGCQRAGKHFRTALHSRVQHAAIKHWTVHSAHNAIAFKEKPDAGNTGAGAEQNEEQATDLPTSIQGNE